ncbi:hypothetical protein FOZ63_010792, partial [Perkinsus olseni]
MTMGYLAIVLIYLTIGPSHGSQSLPEARPVQWLFGSPVANDNRYYIEPLRMNEEYDVSSPGPTVINGFQCKAVKQLTTEPKDTPISIVWVYGIDEQTNRQRTYMATAQTEDPTRECFSSIDPHRPNILRELNEICNTVGFRVLNTSDPSEIKDGTYSGDKDYLMGLEAEVQGGKINHLTSHDAVSPNIDKLSYFGVGHVISVTVVNQKNPDQYTRKTGTLILEPESRALPLQYDAITRRNLGSWDHDNTDYEDINEDASHERGTGKLWDKVHKMALPQDAGALPGSSVSNVSAAVNPSPAVLDRLTTGLLRLDAALFYWLAASCPKLKLRTFWERIDSAHLRDLLFASAISYPKKCLDRRFSLVTTTMDYLSIVLIYLTIGPSHGSQSLPEARPVQWLFGSPVANDN